MVCVLQGAPDRKHGFQHTALQFPDTSKVTSSRQVGKHSGKQETLWEFQIVKDVSSERI